MENKDLKKEDTQKQFGEFLDALQNLPDDKKHCKNNKEWEIKDPVLQEQQSRWLERYIKEPHLFDNHSQEAMISFLIDGAFKADRPMQISSNEKEVFYAGDHLSLALKKLDGKHIDLITALADRIPADKIIGGINPKTLDPKSIHAKYLDTHANLSHKNCDSHLHDVADKINETNRVIHPLLKKEWKNIATILAEKASPQQLHNFVAAHEYGYSYRDYGNSSNNPIAKKYDSIKSQFKDKNQNTSKVNYGKQTANNDSEYQGGGRSNDDGLTPVKVAVGVAALDTLTHDGGAGHSVSEVKQSSQPERYAESGGYSRGGSGGIDWDDD